MLTHVAVPTFTATSSSELDEKLNRMREELFIPFSLSVAQRKMMFKQKYADRLNEEPFTATIGDADEEFDLRPMDPQTRPTLNEAFETIALMKTPADWQNIVPFLVGLRRSNRILTDGRWEWLVRKAGGAHALGTLLECAKLADSTGFRFSRAGVAMRYFFELHRTAHSSGLSDPVVDKCLRLGQQAVSLMEDADHAVGDPALDPKRSPFTIGVLLELSAIRAINQFNGKDEDGHVAAYAQRLLGVWRRVSFNDSAKNWTDIDHMLQENVPIFNGIKLALNVKGITKNESIGPSLSKALADLGKWITSQKQKAPENVRQRPTIGYQQAASLHRN